MKILFAGVVPGYSWLNDFDDPVNFRCPGADEHVTNFKSIDDQGNKNDRRWDFNCTKGGSEGKQPKVTNRQQCYRNPHSTSIEAVSFA